MSGSRFHDGMVSGMQDQPVYPVTCFHCRQPYDAVTAEDCHCLHLPRSLCCPHCQKCFCDASQNYKTEFWANAPRELWSRRKSPLEAAPPGATAEALQRPLVLFADDD